MKFNTLKTLTTNTISAFAAGVVFTIFFNLIVNKEPFKINSDSISALANLGTFIVALIASLQVKHWLATKRKETGFNQTVKILEIIEKSHEDIEPLLKHCASIKLMTSSFGEVILKDDEKKALQENIRKVDLFCDRLSMSLIMLKYWDIKLTHKKQNEINEFIKSLRDANLILNSMLSFPKDLEGKINQATDHHGNAFRNLKSFINDSYKDIFVHKAAPLSKEID